MPDSENPSTLNDWPVGSSAFGLYLVVGAFLALAIIGVFGLSGRGRQCVVKEHIKPTITAAKHSIAAGPGSGNRLPEKGTNPTASK